MSFQKNTKRCSSISLEKYVNCIRMQILRIVIIIYAFG
jgi:hypothetical protein